MSFRTKFILILLSATLTLYTVVGGWISTNAQQPANDPNAQLRKGGVLEGTCAQHLINPTAAFLGAGSQDWRQF